LMRTANQLVNVCLSDKYEIVVIEETGIGGGVLDRVREIFGASPKKPRILGASFNNTPSKDYAETCKDLITELFKRAEELTEAGEIGLNDDGELFAQLTNRKYDYKNGLMVMESKEVYKGRTGAGSPDEGDAFLLALFGLISAGRTTRTVAIGREKIKANWE